MTLDTAHWQERLDLLADKHGVVGASLAVRLGAEEVAAVTGVLSLDTGTPVREESVFLVGSITKTWTATLIMQLVDDGLLDLDAPVVIYLPTFRVLDPMVTLMVTTRQLLSHVSGIEGDFFHDTGRGDDALALFVSAMSGLTQSVPLGSVYSYSHAAFCLLGHLVATLRGAPWETVVRERLFTPLGLTRIGTFPEEALLQAFSNGHLFNAETGTSVSQVWGPVRSVGPAGIIHSTASEQLVFAAMHLAGGLAPDGTRVLSEDSVAAMRVPHVDVKGTTDNTRIGLAWFLSEWDGEPVFGHTGAITGHTSFLDVVPGKALSICLLTNGGRDVSGLYEDLSTEIAAELVGLSRPAPLAPPSPALPIDTAAFVGRYLCEGFDTSIVDTAPGVIEMRTVVVGELAGLLPDMTLELVAYADDVLLARVIGTSEWIPAVFFDMDGISYLQAAERAFRKVADTH